MRVNEVAADIMKLLHTVAYLLVLVLAAFAAAYIFHVSGPGSGGAWEEFLDSLRLERWTAFWVSVAAICLLALVVLTRLPKRARERFLSFENEGGTLSISTTAITDFLAKLANEFSAVTSMKPQVIPGRNEVDIVLNVKVKAGSEVHDLCQLLQQRVRESMINGLGILSVRNVQVNVVEITSEHKFAWQSEE